MKFRMVIEFEDEFDDYTLEDIDRLVIDSLENGGCSQVSVSNVQEAQIEGGSNEEAVQI